MIPPSLESCLAGPPGPSCEAIRWMARNVCSSTAPARDWSPQALRNVVGPVTLVDTWRSWVTAPCGSPRSRCGWRHRRRTSVGSRPPERTHGAVPVRRRSTSFGTTVLTGATDQVRRSSDRPCYSVTLVETLAAMAEIFLCDSFNWTSSRRMSFETIVRRSSGSARQRSSVSIPRGTLRRWTR